MVEKTREIQVTNRNRGSIGYTVPDLGNLRRHFESGETKTLTFDELEKLSWVPGGRYILKNSLVIHDEEAVKELLNGTEPEYYYTEEDVKRLLTTGSLNEFLDCLDFAPEGVLNIVKNLAVSLPLNDVAKRDAIFEKLNFNVTKAIELKQAAEEQKTESVENKRRAAAPSKTTEAAPARRVIIKKSE